MACAVGVGLPAIQQVSQDVFGSSPRTPRLNLGVQTHSIVLVIAATHARRDLN